MFSQSLLREKHGMTLIEVLIAIAVFMLIFGGLMVSFQFALKLIGSSKAQAGAVALASEEMEYIKSLPYDDVGTVGGIPNGQIAQVSTTTLNGIQYTKRVLIEYVDDPADGTGASDSNGIVADYKLVKVEFDWTYDNTVKEISLISNCIPPGIETTAGGGTLIVNVFDAKVLPVSGAAVHIYNDTGTTTIDTTRYTNVDGVALFSGAPALSNYQITVTKAGYSTDGTYVASSTNPNPTTQPVAVLASQVSTMNFQIDRLSDLTVKTLNPPTLGTFADSFTSSSSIATSSDVAFASSSVLLSGAPGSFSATGTLFSTEITPGTLQSWGTLSYQAAVPADTSAVVHLYTLTGSSTYTLIPDSDLGGNAAGFAPGNIDLRALDVTAYPSIILGATLHTDNAATSSQLQSWKVSYTKSQTTLPNISLMLTGAKSIGTNASSAPVYKYQHTINTGASGTANLTDMEWDVYSVSLGSPSYDIAEACGWIPYTLNPGVSDTLSLTLVPASTNSLRVRVIDTSGAPVPNAAITLSEGSYNKVLQSSACGQAFFNDAVAAASDYQVTVQAAGYIDASQTDVLVSGASVDTVTMSNI